MNRLTNLALSVGETLFHEAGRLLFGVALGAAKQFLGTSQPLGRRQLAFPRVLQKKTIDGALLAGPRTQKEYEKFTLKKGLPTEGQPRTLAVENAPHSVNDFNGVIEEGYGRGEKRLLYSGTGVIKVGSTACLGKINVHAHNAAKAGLHYDFVAEGVDPHTESFEVNIPNGALKGRYAFRQAFENGHYLVLRMKDNSALVEKPDIHLKPQEFLKTLSQSGRPLSVEWKDDGSLSNVAIHNLRAVYRSHRPEGESYYDKLPALEDLRNRSAVYLARRLFPGPEQEGTVLRGEPHHPDGPARVGGILWSKVKANDTLDVRVTRCIEGAGKFAGSLGAMVVEGPTGVASEIGSFQLTNEQRRWIWEHRDMLTGQIAEVRALTVNESGAIRAGVFVRFHPSKSEQGLLLYSESLAGLTDPDESRSMMFRLKSSAGWKRQAE
jgi:hypothetical protein